MSHITKITVKISDLDALGSAVVRLDGELRRGQTTCAYYLGATATCDHALHFKQHAYEVGVVRNADGSFGLIWDADMTPLLGRDAAKIKQAYATEVAIKAARRQGHSVTETRAQDGSIVLKVRA